MKVCPAKAGAFSGKQTRQGKSQDRDGEGGKLIDGKPSVLGIESSITRAYQRLSFRALGFFVIYVCGRCYGRRSSDSTMLACSYDEVERRIAMRGTHTVPFANESDAGKIAR